METSEFADTRDCSLSQPITRLKRESTPVNSLAVEIQTTSIFHGTLNILANGKLLFMKSNLSTLDF